MNRRQLFWRGSLWLLQPQSNYNSQLSIYKREQHRGAEATRAPVLPAPPSPCSPPLSRSSSSPLPFQNLILHWKGHFPVLCPLDTLMWGFFPLVYKRMFSFQEQGLFLQQLQPRLINQTFPKHCTAQDDAVVTGMPV